MDAKFRIVKATIDNIDDIYDLAINSNLAYWRKEDYLNELQRVDSMFLILLNKEDRFTGFLTAKLIPGSINEFDAELNNIAIVPSFRGYGGAKHLISHFISLCRKSNVGNIWLDVRESNVPAIRLYKHFGFENIYKRKLYYSSPPEDALIMSLLL